MRRLFIVWASKRLLCRSCAGLTYVSQRQPPYTRKFARLEAARKRLGADVGLRYPPPPKPKGMHWSTYERLRRELVEAESDYYDEVALRVTAARTSLKKLEQRSQRLEAR